MSASMVRKSLAIVDADFNAGKGNGKGGKRERKKKNLIPDNHKLTKKVSRKGHKETIEVLKTQSKITVAEARKVCKSKEQTLKENLKKLKLIQQACTIDLEKEITDQLIQRAVMRRPVHVKNKSKKVQKTAFTEEDFEKFEAEYFDE